MIETILTFLKTYSAETGTVTGLMTIGAGLWVFLYGPFRKDKKLDLSNETIDKIAVKRSDQGPQLTVTEFIRVRREMKAELEAEFATAHADEKTQLSARIAELESQIANPQEALEVAQKRIAELEALLERSGNDIGGDRIAEARVALERGDYSIADDLFAEIEVRRELEVQEAARAARLDPTYDTLVRAGNLLWRAGRHSDAIWHEEQLVKIAKQEFGADHQKTGTALNNLAESYKASRRYEEAEPLYREAVAVIEAALGGSIRTARPRGGICRCFWRSGGSEWGRVFGGYAEGVGVCGCW